ncbi:MAG TPA: hypothetical protein VN673_12625, partial [Clostridia bacterium]|nr:hypothetical protein [Clostridia bacterium]
MSHSIQLVAEGQYALLAYYGEMGFEEVAAVRQEIANLLLDKKWHRVLVDALALHSNPRPAELVELGRSLTRFLPRYTRIALLVRPDQARNARCLEKMARNREVFLTFFLNA